MKLCLENQWFDDDGKPLSAGRLTVYKHDSDVMMTLYTLSGSEYVETSNPVIVANDGRIASTYYDAGIVDVKIEKPNLDGTYELLDTMTTGFDMDDTVVKMGVDTVAALNTVDPDAYSVIQVNGYYKLGDAPSRIYVWDEGLTADPDGGYLRSSSVKTTGRWVLLWTDEVLPCSVYGVSAGTEANMSALFSYPTQVGSMHIATAPIVRFAAGIYKTTVNYTTSKAVMIDSGAQFSYATITCDHLIVNNGSGNFGDFRFTSKYAEAYANWFKTFTALMSCGASKIYMDGSGPWKGGLTTNVTVSNCVIYGADTTWDGATSSAYTLTFDHVKFVNKGCPVYNMGTTPVVLNNCEVSDRDLLASTIACQDCTLLAHNFDNLAYYVVWSRTMGKTEFDLEGGAVAALSCLADETYRNARVTAAAVNGNCTFEDCDIASLILADIGTASATLTLKRCNVTLVTNNYDYYTVYAVNSRIGSALQAHVLTGDNTVFSDILISDYTDSACTLVQCKTGSVTSANLFATDTIFDGIVWTRDDGGEYTAPKVTCGFLDCTFLQYQVIKFDTTKDVQTPAKVVGYWIGNSFLHSSEFIKVVAYQSDNSTHYLSTTETDHTWQYKGNTGPAVIPDYDEAVAFVTKQNYSVNKSDPSSSTGTSSTVNTYFRLFGFGTILSAARGYFVEEEALDGYSNDVRVLTNHDYGSGITLSLTRYNVSDYWAVRFKIYRNYIISNYKTEGDSAIYVKIYRADGNTAAQVAL